MEAEKITIKKYLERYIDNDYAISIFCYKLRVEAKLHNYSLKGVQVIDIEKQCIPNPARVLIKDLCSSQIDTFSLLLSLRAITLDHTLLKMCDDNHLLFTEITLYYKWVEYIDIINKMSSDEEFNNIFQIIKELKANNTISSDSLSVFDAFTIDPGQNNIINYYKSLSSTINKVGNGVIPDHYYLGAENIENYTITSKFKYIGSGAFAYCKNLKSITIKAKDLMLGPFAIIECDNLKEIIVPDESVQYYKESLPYYKDIIISQSRADGMPLESVESDQDELPDANTSLESTVVPESANLSIPEIHETIPVVEVINGEIPEPVVEVITEAPTVPVFSAFDSSKLKNVFDSKVTTYKYFWYMSFLAILNEKQTKSIPIIDMEIMMVTKAWPYLCHDGLDFGSSDQIKKIIEDIRKKTYLIENASESVVYNQMNYHVDSLKGLLAPLSKNVPFRFISPWIKYTSDQEVMEASQQNNTAPYALYEDKIVFDDDRLKFFTEHYDEQQQFIKKSLKEYLNKYNNAFKMLKLMLK